MRLLARSRWDGCNAELQDNVIDTKNTWPTFRCSRVTWISSRRLPGCKKWKWMQNSRNRGRWKVQRGSPEYERDQARVAGGKLSQERFKLRRNSINSPGQCISSRNIGQSCHSTREVWQGSPVADRSASGWIECSSRSRPTAKQSRIRVCWMLLWLMNAVQKEKVKRGRTKRGRTIPLADEANHDSSDTTIQCKREFKSLLLKESSSNNTKLTSRIYSQALRNPKKHKDLTTLVEQDK